ncbi:hypothetical protein LXL04_009037 [Taraxacum kok-saghyz]
MDPITLYNWIIENENTFYACQCSYKLKVKYVINVLKGDVLDWWIELKTKINIRALGNMTSDEFFDRLDERFCSKDEVCNLEREFLNLKKEKMMVADYIMKFQMLLSFLRRLTPDDETKVDC